jgi:hypothetical protein
MSKKGNVTVYYPCNPERFGGQTQFPVTFIKGKIFMRPAPKPYKPYTIGTQVDELIQEWYAERGLPVPPEENGLAASIDAVEKEERDRTEGLHANTQVNTAVKPEFGTPEFWAWARAKRAETNKERAEKGLPPLPTAKEKAAAKAAKAAAKAAKV